MTRRLSVVAPDDTLDALRAALAGGDAVMPVSGAPVDADAAPRDVPPEVPQRIAVVIETSGSTARPKRVALSADALLASAAASASALGGAGTWLLALPTHYIAGLNVLVRSIAAGTTPVVLRGSFTPAAFVGAVDGMATGPRFTSLVPAQLARVLDDRESIATARRLDGILLGGQAAPPGLVERARDAGLAVTRTYGSSETSGGCVYDGVPLGDTRVRIVDGLVELAGSVLAEGYLDAELTAERFVDERGARWFRTGDLGAIDVHGRLTVTGRADDVIISGGVKVALGEVEQVIRGLPGLGDAVVVAAPHAEWGRAPVVVTAADAQLEGIRSVVGERLGVAARPVRVVRVDAVPLLPSGKPDRRGLERLVRASTD